MRYMFLTAVIVTGLSLFASSTPANTLTVESNVKNLHQNWGFILVESNRGMNGKNYIGYGGFEDKTSCIVEAKKRMNDLSNPSKYEVLCYTPFELKLAPYKVASATSE